MKRGGWHIGECGPLNEGVRAKAIFMRSAEPGWWPLAVVGSSPALPTIFVIGGIDEAR